MKTDNGVGFRFDACMTPGDPAAGGDGTYPEDEYYLPSEEEVAQALEDAERMNFNMRTYGTIDAPAHD